jgi:hypothetical protein
MKFDFEACGLRNAVRPYLYLSRFLSFHAIFLLKPIFTVSVAHPSLWTRGEHVARPPIYRWHQYIPTIFRSPCDSSRFPLASIDTWYCISMFRVKSYFDFNLILGVVTPQFIFQTLDFLWKQLDALVRLIKFQVAYLFFVERTAATLDCSWFVCLTTTDFRFHSLDLLLQKAIFPLVKRRVGRCIWGYEREECLNIVSEFAKLFENGPGESFSIGVEQLF